MESVFIHGYFFKIMNWLVFFKLGKLKEYSDELTVVKGKEKEPGTSIPTSTTASSWYFLDWLQCRTLGYNVDYIFFQISVFNEHVTIKSMRMSYTSQTVIQNIWIHLKMVHFVNKCLEHKRTNSVFLRAPQIMLSLIFKQEGIYWTRRKKSFLSLFSTLEKAMAPHSSTLAWKIPRTEEPGGLQSMELQRVGHDWASSLSLFTFPHWRRKWQPTPVFSPGESQRWGSLVGCRLWGRTELDTTEWLNWTECF